MPKGGYRKGEGPKRDSLGLAFSFLWCPLSRVTSLLHSFEEFFTMGLKSTLAALLLAVPTGLAHPGHEEKIYQHNALPLERKSLAHCEKHFKEEEFARRTVERHTAEFSRLRRAIGIEDEPYGFPHILKEGPDSDMLTYAVGIESRSRDEITSRFPRLTTRATRRFPKPPTLPLFLPMPEPAC